MKRSLMAPLGACAVALASSLTSAGVVYQYRAPAGAYDRFYTGFAVTPPISSTDLAQGIAPVALSGGASFSTSNAGLTNGPDQVNGGSDGGITTGGGFATEGQFYARMRIDLPQPEQVSQINMYTWHSGSRLDQVVDVYGAVTLGGGGAQANPPPNPDVPPTFIDPLGHPYPKTDDPGPGHPDDYGWTYLFTVDTRIPGGTNGYTNHTNGQIASSFDPVPGIAIGGQPLRYFLFDIFAAAIDDRGASSGYFGEIDIIQAVPEPASLAMLGIGMMGLIARRRRVQV